MFLDIAPLTPQELFWFQVEEYLPVIGIGLLLVAAVVFVAVKLIKKAIDKKEK